MKTLLVIPCYCEQKRLPKFLPELCQRIDASGSEIDIQLVDDGSPEEEQAALKGIAFDARMRFPFVHPPRLLPQNLGKGGAIRAAWDKADGYDILAFVDADGAASAKETVRFLKTVGSDGNAKRIHIAIRQAKGNRNLQRTLSRKMIAKGFNTLINKRYDIQVTDTQCGLKALPRAFYQNTRDTLRQNGYAFDLELLLAAKNQGLEISTLPIDWREIPGSTTNMRHALAFLLQILFRKI